MGALLLALGACGPDDGVSPTGASGRRMPAAETARSTTDALPSGTGATTTPDDEPGGELQALAVPAPWPEEAPYLHKGLWVGSWAPNGELGFDESWVDEPGLRRVMTNDRAGRRRWAGAASGGPVFPIDPLVRDRQGPAVAYVYSLVARSAEVDAPSAQQAFPEREAVLHLRHQGRVALRVDGELVLDVPSPTDGGWAVAQAPVTLTGPYDVLLVKCGRGSPELGPSMAFEVRLSDTQGRPLPGQSWNSMRPPGLPSDLDG